RFGVLTGTTWGIGKELDMHGVPLSWIEFGTDFLRQTNATRSDQREHLKFVTARRHQPLFCQWHCGDDAWWLSSSAAFRGYRSSGIAAEEQLIIGPHDQRNHFRKRRTRDQ